MQLGGIVAVRKRIVAVPVCTSSTTSICIQITGISCRSSSSRPPLGISAAKPVGGARTGRVWTSWRRRYLGRSSSLEGSPPNAPRTFPPERAQNGRRCAPRSCSATRWPRRVVCGGRGRPAASIACLSRPTAWARGHQESNSDETRGREGGYWCLLLVRQLW